MLGFDANIRLPKRLEVGSILTENKKQKINNQSLSIKMEQLKNAEMLTSNKLSFGGFVTTVVGPASGVGCLKNVLEFTLNKILHRQTYQVFQTKVVKIIFHK